MIPLILSSIREVPPLGWEEGLLWDIWNNLLRGDRPFMLLRGLGISARIAVFGAMIGWVIGFSVALIRISKSKILALLRAITTVYISVIRGVPLLVQLMIWWFVIVGSADADRLFVCIICFGVSSGAYVSEVFRAGILSVDKGQTEAGRSVGLSAFKTMTLIVFPQAVKNALPALVNDFTILFKDTSVVGFIGMVDMLRAANHITAFTFNSFIPLITVAIVYWSVVTPLIALMSRLERRLRKSDSR
ncbi:MAG: amino acid ABC transporter permease [Oscillospiraceae bacterium]|nr:amino acid ABC transporter permease [Oscillospiraceae bacterium]